MLGPLLESIEASHFRSLSLSSSVFGPIPPSPSIMNPARKLVARPERLKLPS